MNLTWEIFAAIVGVVLALGGVAVKWITSTIDASAAKRDAATSRIESTQNDIKDDLSTIRVDFEKRVDRLEQRSGGFMPRSEIVNAVEHEKNNRIAAHQGLAMLVDKNTAQIVDLKVNIGKLESSHDGLAHQVGEVKQMLRDQGEATNKRLDKIADCLNEVAKKA